MPSRRATAIAVVRLSPVSMTIAMPSACSAVSAGAVVVLDRIGDGDDAGGLAVDGDEDRGRAVAPAAARLRRRARRLRCRARRGSGRCRARRAGARPCRWRPCRSANRSRAPARARSCARRRPATIAAASGCSLARSTLAARRSNARLRRSPPRPDARPPSACPRSACRSCRRTSVSTFSMRSSASAFLIRTPACAPRPTPTMIDIGVARPSAQGQAMISTRDGRHQAEGEARLRTEDRPGGKGQHGDRDHGRARTRPTPDRPAAGSARGCAAPPPPSARSAPASCRGRPSRRA